MNAYFPLTLKDYGDPKIAGWHRTFKFDDYPEESHSSTMLFQDEEHYVSRGTKGTFGDDNFLTFIKVEFKKLELEVYGGNRLHNILKAHQAHVWPSVTFEHLMISLAQHQKASDFVLSLARRMYDKGVKNGVQQTKDRFCEFLGVERRGPGTNFEFTPMGMT
jgi:hypothetical protein